jgi:GntR family transcriptional regulator
MEIRIDKQSEVPVRDQLRQQLIFLIGTGQLSIGSALPSVRELARRLKVHHNTVSHVYSQLARDGWLIKKHGSRLIVGRQVSESQIESFADLDDLINRTIQLARSHGYSLQQLTDRVRERLSAQPPDHLLLVAPERQIGTLMRAEIREASGQEPDACSVSMLQQNASIAIGAVVITPSYLMTKVDPFLATDRMVVPITYSGADEHVAAIGSLTQASVIGVVSVSAFFLETANGLLAPAIGSRHSFREFLFVEASGSGTREARFISYVPNQDAPELSEIWAIPEERFRCQCPISRPAHGSTAEPEWLSSDDLRGLDLLFCDSLAYRIIKHPRKLKYRLISPESLVEVDSAAKSMTSPEEITIAGRLPGLLPSAKR